MTALPGETVAGCRVVERIGEGTLSEVYRAVQESLSRDVAVKILKPSVSPASQLGARFGREAALLAHLAHQNIPQVYDSGTTSNGRPYILIELVEGTSLSALAKRVSPLPVDVAAVIALKIARALEYVHLRGIIHRDTKPSNVLVSVRGEVKLADFGLARDLSEPPHDGLGVVGTPAYMSPEQVLGDRLDFRSDLFAFGIVFYEMLTARRPFEEEPARTVMQKIRLDRYVPPRRVRPDVPALLERVLARCLEKNPAHRYASTGTLCDDLNEYLARAGVISHEARLVAFLREYGVITEEQSRRALGPAAAAWATPASYRGALKSFATGHAALGALLLGTLTALEVSRARGGAHEAATALGPRPVGTPGVGYLRVLSRPWAEVSIDGTTVDTTPTARAFPLAPGTHYVRFRHPSFLPEDRAVQVTSGATAWVDVDLTPAGEAGRGR